MQFQTDTGSMPVKINRLLVAGWTGRDAAAVQHHIDELAALGVPAPSTVPLYYQASVALLTRGKRIEVLSGETSGEAEPFVLRADNTLWLGLGSDHTDRGLETFSVAHAKQICAKPLASTLWRLDEIADLDKLELRSWIEEGAGWTLYQEGTLASIRPLSELIGAGGLGDDEAMLCGTLSAIGGVRPATRFRMELRDPATGMTISHEYEVQVLSVVK
jgi:hypothetical protein